MGNGRQLMLALDTVHDHERFFASASTGAIGDRAVVRRDFEQGWNRFFQEGAISFGSFRRKKLEGDNRLPGGGFCRVNLANQLHGVKDGGRLSKIQTEGSLKQRA